MNKSYLYKHDWEENSESEEDLDKAYDKTDDSKIKINFTKLFQEDEIEQIPQEMLAEWQREDPMTAKNGKKLYSRDLCFNRFQFNRQKHSGAGDEEKKFEEDDEEFGQ